MHRAVGAAVLHQSQNSTVAIGLHGSDILDRALLKNKRRPIGPLGCLTREPEAGASEPIHSEALQADLIKAKSSIVRPRARGDQNGNLGSRHWLKIITNQLIAKQKATALKTSNCASFHAILTYKSHNNALRHRFSVTGALMAQPLSTRSKEMVHDER